MNVVIDSSVALKWVLPEDGSDVAMALRSQSLIAPSHWLVEAANVLWRYVRIGRFGIADAATLLQELAAAPVISVSSPDDLFRALEIAAKLQHPVYDCLYLAVAMREGVQVVTADKRFLRACDRDTATKGRVRLLDPA
jgi:predicted nucleic acid-binding protein